MDRNQVIGFSLLAALLIAYVFYNQHEQQKYTDQKRTDSIAYAKAHPKPIIDSSKLAAQAAAIDTLPDSVRKLMPPALAGKSQTVTLENGKLALQFNTKGAYPVSANIKAYKTYGQKPLYLFNGNSNHLSAILPYDNGRSTADLYFEPVTKDEPNGDKSIDFVADLGGGKKVDIIYTLPANDYLMRCDIRLTGMPTNVPLKLSWETQAIHTEKDITLERTNSQVYYRYKNNSEDFFTIRNDDKKSLSDGATQWLGFRKQYFSTALWSDDGFSRVDVAVSPKKDDTGIVAQTAATMDITPGTNGVASFKWYIGPNDYKVLKAYGVGLEDMVPVGSGIMSFVKYINRYALIPIFYFLGSFIGNYAIIIILMTLLIRVILSFFTYKSYLSSAKMRVLKPELDELRVKYAGDQQKFGMEQMKLYRSAGVNPLGGCLPLLFQLPFLFAMYYLFPSFIEFRQQHFLWANDLSTYDSILNLPFNIPWYGDHVSLFTLLMTASSLFVALFNRNMTPQDPNNPMMKYMPYIMPVIFLGVFNKMAAALTFYYTFSNLLSIAQQFLIQKYFIDEKAIHAKLQENKNKPATPSKWAQRLEDMQKAQTERAKNQQQPRRNK
jgi:YidC/Oxa1 family membrane protein insertase